jgi:hypothetical protein
MFSNKNEGNNEIFNIMKLNCTYGSSRDLVHNIASTVLGHTETSYIQSGPLHLMFTYWTPEKITHRAHSNEAVCVQFVFPEDYKS